MCIGYDYKMKIESANAWLERAGGTKFRFCTEDSLTYETVYKIEYTNPSGRISDVFVGIELEDCIEHAINVLLIPPDKDLENNIGLTLRDVKKINFSRPSRDIRKLISHYLPFRKSPL